MIPHSKGLILDGWDHPKLKGNDRLMSANEFDEWLKEYLSESGGKILADFRRHDFGNRLEVPGRKRPK